MGSKASTSSATSGLASSVVKAMDMASLTSDAAVAYAQHVPAYCRPGSSCAKNSAASLSAPTVASARIRWPAFSAHSTFAAA